MKFTVESFDKSVVVEWFNTEPSIMKDVQKSIRGCRECSAKGESPYKPWVPYGEEDSEYVFCTITPGVDMLFLRDGFLSKDFVGKLFKKYIDVLGVDAKKEIYFTSLLFCHVLGNRGPWRQEVGTCLQYKRKEFSILKKARYIFLFGNAVVQGFTNYSFSVMELFGKVMQYVDGGRRYLIFPCYHPGHVEKQSELSQTQLDFIYFSKGIIDADKSGNLKWKGEDHE